eukprot:jgi/Botrbrau1/7474/Bobra.0095s0012.1
MGPNGAVQRRWPGCTALAALILGNKLIIANAGDCRAVACRRGDAVQVSHDQTADRQDERERILASGGRVSLLNGHWRVGSVGIQVSRSLGDGDAKADGVIAEPEVEEFTLTEEDTFLILASDGLWDKITPREAVGLVHDTVKEPSLCAKRLGMEALTRGSQDNITVIVAFLRPTDTLEEIYRQGMQKYKVTATSHGSRAVMQGP